MKVRTLCTLSSGLAAVAALMGTPAKADGASWNGCYVGAHLGWAGASSTVTDQLYPSGPFAGATAWNAAGDQISPSSDGVTGGGQVGCDTTVSTQQGMAVVLGAIGDVSALDASGTATSAIAADTNASFSADFTATLRARLGVAQGSYLVYATGGLAFADVTISAADLSSVPSFAQMSVSGSSLEVGWVVGGGVEWKLANNWSLGVEYLHMDFGSVTASGAALNIPGAVPTFTGDLEIDSVRAVLNYRM